jgi:nucleotide-binding universal stress UspA family protein
MKEIRKILFPVDFSEVTPKVAPYVITMAEKFDAEVHVLFVAGTLYYLADMFVPQPSIEQLETEMVKGARKKMRKFTNDVFKPRVAVKKRIAHGDPAEEIISYIKSEGIDLVIMGTHGRKGISQILFGSVANTVTKVSPAPVLTVNPYRAL